MEYLAADSSQRGTMFCSRNTIIRITRKVWIDKPKLRVVEENRKLQKQWISKAELHSRIQHRRH
jgi:hypothetical protein